MFGKFGMSFVPAMFSLLVTLLLELLHALLVYASVVNDVSTLRSRHSHSDRDVTELAREDDLPSSVLAREAALSFRLSRCAGLARPLLRDPLEW